MPAVAAQPALIRYVDDFYPDGAAVRTLALNSEFYQPPNLYGFRTRRAFLPDGTVERIGAQFGFDRITLRNVPTRTGHFYTSLARGRERVRFFAHYDAVHRAARPSYAMLVYLTPDAPKTAGTGVYRHRTTGIWRGQTAADCKRLGLTRAKLDELLDADSQNRRRWELLDRVDNVFNRAVLFPAHWYHSSTQEFGSRADNGKLYHAFFFEAWPDVFAGVAP